MRMERASRERVESLSFQAPQAVAEFIASAKKSTGRDLCESSPASRLQCAATVVAH